MRRPLRFNAEKETHFEMYMKLSRIRDRPGRAKKISPAQGFEPRTVQPVASRCTAKCLPAAILFSGSLKYQNRRKSFLNLSSLPTNFKFRGTEYSC